MRVRNRAVIATPADLTAATPGIEERARQHGTTIIGWRILSVPNSRRNIALTPIDAVPRVADIPVPIGWTRGIKLAAGSTPRVVPRAPGIWAGGRRRRGGNRAQSQAGQTQTAKHQHRRCVSRNSVHDRLLSGGAAPVGFASAVQYRPSGWLPIPTIRRKCALSCRHIFVWGSALVWSSGLLHFSLSSCECSGGNPAVTTTRAGNAFVNTPNSTGAANSLDACRRGGRLWGPSAGWRGTVSWPERWRRR